jgi:hypothetical protein
VHAKVVALVDVLEKEGVLALAQVHTATDVDDAVTLVPVPAAVNPPYPSPLMANT